MPMKNKIKSLLIIIFSLLFLAGCLRQDTPAIDETLQHNINFLFEEYKTGINQAQKSRLERIVGKDFIYYVGTKKEYIEGLLKWMVCVDNISYRVTKIDDYKIYAEAKIKGTLVYKPIVNLPLFARQLKLLPGDFEKDVLFTLAYEKDEIKIIGQQDGTETKYFQGGTMLPDIKTFALDKYQAVPGDMIKVNISVDKGANDVIFIFINNSLLSGFSDQGEVPYNKDSFTVSIPLSYPSGKTFDITAMAFAGKMELTRPDQAELRGVIIKTIAVPVR
jgi:hypothetical protein